MKAGDVETAINHGWAMSEQSKLNNVRRDLEKHHVLVPQNYCLESVDNNLLNPLRKKGQTIFWDARSFCWYVNKHKDDEKTIIIANELKGEICAILNDHATNEPNWGDFRVILKLGLSRQWEIWTEYEKKRFSQSEFADFIEDNRSDLMTGIFTDANGDKIINLSYLEWGALLDDLRISSNEKLETKFNRRTGETVFNYQNEENKGQFGLPSCLYLAIPIYRGGDLFQIKLNIRYRRDGGHLTFYFIIDESDKIMERAFEKICAQIKDGAGQDADGESFDGVGLQILKGEF